MNTDRTLLMACWIARIALAAAFLSAVADRLGLWGAASAAPAAS